MQDYKQSPAFGSKCFITVETKTHGVQAPPHSSPMSPFLLVPRLLTPNTALISLLVNQLRQTVGDFFQLCVSDNSSTLKDMVVEIPASTELQ